MDISATAAELREAMRVSVHFLEVDGEKHFANVNDPDIPEALASAIVGIVSIHDFRPHPMVKPRTQYTYTDSNGTFQAVTPADLAEIYNLNPLFSQGITGADQTVVVVEDSDPFKTTDWTTFEQEFKLTQYGGTLSVTHPNVTGFNNCTDPGDNADDDRGCARYGIRRCGSTGRGDRSGNLLEHSRRPAPLSRSRTSALRLRTRTSSA